MYLLTTPGDMNRLVALTGIIVSPVNLDLLRCTRLDSFLELNRALCPP
jgi:hypothetical protein